MLRLLSSQSGRLSGTVFCSLIGVAAWEPEIRSEPPGGLLSNSRAGGAATLRGEESYPNQLAALTSGLEQPRHPCPVVDVDVFGRGFLRQAGHGHHITGQRDNEPRTGAGQ